MTQSSEFKAGISVAPVTDWRYYDSKSTEAYMKTPDENPEGYEATNLVARAKDLHGRLLSCGARTTTTSIPRTASRSRTP